MKSFSITRLKLWYAWLPHQTQQLEMKSFSITRLKLVKNDGAGVNDITLEMKSFSITRLKQQYNEEAQSRAAGLKWKASRLRDWNFAGLTPPIRDRFFLEMKSFSITRLKLAKYTDPRTYIYLEMKSFSITRLKLPSQKGGSFTIRMIAWNEKLLDYEIETTPNIVSFCSRSITLKWKASRLRDWNPCPLL